ncbi:MAG TPA: hypothetical protein VME21_16795, partial [Steroidobacteraceae bacterium]|nr:hypothetical protein [Steroidobacteraceae bacterium]
MRNSAQAIIAVKSFAAAQVPPHRRLAYWDEVAATTYTPVVTQSWDPPTFAPELRRAHLGPLRIAEVVSSAGSLLHTEQHVQRTAERVLFLQLQAAGESVHEQAGREA